jgi:hypothetical protein
VPSDGGDCDRIAGHVVEGVAVDDDDLVVLDEAVEEVLELPQRLRQPCGE